MEKTVCKPTIGILGARGSVQLPWVCIPTHYANQSYVEAISKNGGTPLLLPPVSDETIWLQMCSLCDGFLFPGGEDVDPRIYNQEPLPPLGAVNIKTDRFWQWVYQYAKKNSLPVLGICRGLQLINAASGGTLYQDISMMPGNHQLHAQKLDRSYLMHQIHIELGSTLEKILKTNTIQTNTMHHQCVDKPGKGFKIAAQTNDNVIEALESEDGKTLLVQWHPEELTETEPRMNLLFRHLINLAKKQY